MTKIKKPSSTIKIRDGESEFKEYLHWLARLNTPFQNLKNAFNSNFCELFEEPEPFNRDRLEALFYGTFWKDELYPRIEALVSKKDKPMQSFYQSHYNSLIDQVTQALELFKEALGKNTYRTAYGEEHLPAHLTSFKALPLDNVTLLTRREDLGEQRLKFDTVTEDPAHLQMAELCDQLADVYNQMLANLRKRNSRILRGVWSQGYPPMHLFVHFEGGKFNPIYDNISY